MNVIICIVQLGMIGFPMVNGQMGSSISSVLKWVICKVLMSESLHIIV